VPSSFCPTPAVFVYPCYAPDFLDHAVSGSESPPVPPSCPSIQAEYATAAPGCRHIAIHKAHTANGFSLDTLALSTAMLYTFAQPGHSL